MQNLQSLLQDVDGNTAVSIKRYTTSGTFMDSDGKCLLCKVAAPRTLDRCVAWLKFYYPIGFVLQHLFEHSPARIHHVPSQAVVLVY